jgi:3D (Asp-Asp-Asp) domain-containing protein
MLKRITMLLAVGMLITSVTFAGETKKNKLEQKAIVVKDDDAVSESASVKGASAAKVIAPPKIQADGKPSKIQTALGYVVKGLTGFYDTQSNGQSPNYIALTPGNPNHVHAICTTSTDSSNGGSTRRVTYAFSTNGGQTWASSLVDIIVGRFGSLTTLKDGTAIVADHANQPTGNQTTLYLDASEGAGNFTSYPAPLLNGSTNSDEPIWPAIATDSANTTVWIAASRSSAGTVNTLNYSLSNFTFNTWSGPVVAGGDTLSAGGRDVVRFSSGSNGFVAGTGPGATGAGAGRVYYAATTNKGATFSATQTIYPTGSDTTQAWIGVDGTYLGSEPHIVFSASSNGTPGNATITTGKIMHWSPSLGYQQVADFTNVPAATDTTTKGQVNFINVDQPSVGSSADGKVLFVAFAIYTKQKDTTGWNYANIYYTYSYDKGATWKTPIAVETPGQSLDFRYPSVAKVGNELGADNKYRLNIVYQEKPRPGGLIAGDAGVIPTRLQYLYQKIVTPATLGTAVVAGKTASSFALSQNYPNPFNPSTSINYSVAQASKVTLKVYDILGREVVTLVNEAKPAGDYSVRFNADNLASGVYLYKLQSGAFTETKKMMLVK